MAFEKVEKDLLFDDIVWKDAKRYLREHYPAKDHLLDDILIPVLLIPAFFILFLTHCAWYGWLGFLLPVAYSTFSIAGCHKEAKGNFERGIYCRQRYACFRFIQMVQQTRGNYPEFPIVCRLGDPYDNYKGSKTTGIIPG